MTLEEDTSGSPELSVWENFPSLYSWPHPKIGPGIGCERPTYSSPLENQVLLKQRGDGDLMSIGTYVVLLKSDPQRLHHPSSLHPRDDGMKVHSSEPPGGSREHQ